MLKPRTLLWINDQYRLDGTLHDVIGDGYLLQHNSLFRRARQLFRGEGGAFVCDASNLARSYTAAPLLMLDDILSSRLIPYCANSLALRRLVRQAPGIPVCEEFLITLLNRNFLFHETLHCIGSVRVDNILKVGDTIDSAHTFVIKSAFVEAFANAIERLSFYEAQVPLHLLFMRMNSYVSFNADTCKLLADMRVHFGLKQLFRMGLAVLCLLNLRRSDPTMSDLTTIAEQACSERRLTLAELRLCAETSRRLWGLSKAFRNETSLFFYQIHGCEHAYNSLALQSSFAPPCTSELMFSWADSMSELFFVQNLERPQAGG
jgi:hypothetical protein